MGTQEIKKELAKKSSEEKAVTSRRFFKTGKGDYGEGDIFIGVTVPEVRKTAKKHSSLFFKELLPLLKSKIHEERLCGLEILTMQYENKNTTKEDKEKIYKFILENLIAINNWDLVDLTAPYIIGPHLLNKEKTLLYDFANSTNLWKKRIAIVSTYHFIKNNQFEDTLKIALILLPDKQDLTHKAVGWMLREVGKKDQNLLEKFLKTNYSNLPRTTLRYAIERFSEEKRKSFLKGIF